MSKSKAFNQRFHASRRFAERTDLALKMEHIRRFVKYIQSASKHAVFIERLSLRLTVWDIEHEDRTYRVVYDTMRHTIVTALKPEWTRLDRMLYQSTQDDHHAEANGETEE